MSDFAGYLICISIWFKLIILFLYLSMLCKILLVSCITHSHLARSPLGGVIQLGIGWWPVVRLSSHLFVGRQKFLLPYFMG